jgi:GAF domain-containing protein
VANREALLADTFLKLADTLIDDFDVIDVLTMLSQRCVELLDVAATGILIADAEGGLQLMAASSEAVNLLELFQIQNDDGPCLDAYHTGSPVAHDDLSGPSPWPRFAVAALNAGFLSVHAFPMAVRTKVLGTMNLFMHSPRPLAAPDVVVAQALAHAATLALLQDRSTEDSQRITAQLQGALNNRVTIEQAKGVISHLARIGTDEAFGRLLSYARSHAAKLTLVAADVVNRTLSDADRADLLRAAKPGQTGSP